MEAVATTAVGLEGVREQNKGTTKKSLNEKSTRFDHLEAHSVTISRDSKRCA